ncbi:MAG: hypothetical protein M1828_000969 [Chrysothrix sp. TS-e1954]|nr:MAG: hypothetical protein M1828_000969 [Chrysothrix sp. TS-e1954]
MACAEVDYSLYLVTDSTKNILGDRDIVSLVEEAIDGGVTVVQYRDKTSDTRTLIETASRLHDVTRAKRVPLLINDRVDVALVVGAEGVHLGQDDMELVAARKLLGPDAIIGVTASSVDEACQAAEEGADYLGIGTVWSTATKVDTKSTIGIAGVGRILYELSLTRNAPPTVCIGGVNSANARRVLLGSASSEKRLSGIAVVSAIVAASDPKESARSLRKIVRNSHVSRKGGMVPSLYQHYNDCVKSIASIVQAKPLCHNMTNLVVQNFAANVTLAIGGSPIMSNNGDEAFDLASLGGSLVVNMGTATAESMQNYKRAVAAYNSVGGDIVLDPVGAGATALRRGALREILDCGRFSVIKGNESEIRTVLSHGKDDVKQRGVDSSTSAASDDEKAEIVRELAIRHQNTVLMTGAIDFLSDGQIVYGIENGHSYLGNITGSGCTLGTAIAASLAANKGCGIKAVLAACLAFEIAAERAATRFDVKGAGTFVPAFMDELGKIRDESQEACRQNNRIASWISEAQVTMWDFRSRRTSKSSLTSTNGDP